MEKYLHGLKLVKDYDLSVKSAEILILLMEEGDKTIEELAEKLNTSFASMSNMMLRLKLKSLVLVEKNPKSPLRYYINQKIIN